MTQEHTIRKIAYVGDYVPRKCGIATFTSDLCHAVTEAYPDCTSVVVPVNDSPEGYDYPDEVRFDIQEQDLDAYRRAADFLNFANTDVVCLQHEFGLFGGVADSHILAMLRDLNVPVVTTLHTVLQHPNADQRRVMTDLTALSSRLVVMSDMGRRMLTDIYEAPRDKIDLIPHGIPDVPFADPNFYKDQYGVEGRSVLLTFGLLSPNKGIEHVLRALPAISREFPDVVYIVLGATHPNLVRQQGEVYRMSLERLARELGVEQHVVFYDRFVERDELEQFLAAADIYITPYLNREQVTSGTLAYAFGCGKAVVSTPYWHAEELLADGRGELVPFGDSDAIAREVIGLLRDETRRHAMRKRAYLLGREMVWSKTARMYMDSFRSARERGGRRRVKTLATKVLDDRRRKLPQLRIEHLLAMTDSTGMFQHARFRLPSFVEGYCTDDNARALILTVLLEETGMNNPAIERLATTYAAFLNHAFDLERSRFHNFMSFGRQWLDEVGSEDCQGRALWALGTCVGRSRRRDLQYWAAELFDLATPGMLETTSPRTWAFALLGIHEYFRRLSGDRVVAHIRGELANRLIAAFDECATSDWCWFENSLTYDNAKLPHALILSGRFGDNPRALDVGLKSLRWLIEMQRSERGAFRPVGSDGPYVRNGERFRFDQQPLEAHSTISACIEAYNATADSRWISAARVAFDWFFGQNDLGLEIYDATNGGCRDALQIDRVNQNQGAESTLSFLMSLAEMRLLEYRVDVFEPTAPARSA